MAFGETFWTIIFLFGIIVAILWILLPFAVFGTKDILRENLKTNQDILAELKRLNSQSGK